MSIIYSKYRMTCSENLTSDLRSRVRSALAKVTLEPVLFLSVIYGGMIGEYHIQ